MRVRWELQIKNYKVKSFVIINDERQHYQKRNLCLRSADCEELLKIIGSIQKNNEAKKS